MHLWKNLVIALIAVLVLFAIASVSLRWLGGPWLPWERTTGSDAVTGGSAVP